MSCPDWVAVTAWRLGDGAAPAGWQGSLRHLETCAPCRERVATIDPTVLLAAAAAPTPTTTEEEAKAVAGTVRSMVASERLAAHGRPDRRPLVAAAALLALLAAPLALSRLADRPAVPTTPAEVATILPEPVAAPPVEEVQPAAARVYQFGTEDLPVVLIFDENLDL